MSAEELKRLGLQALIKNKDCLFETFFSLLDAYHETPATTIRELKAPHTKQKGDIFELFCVRYLLTVYGCEEAYRLADIPSEIKERLHLTGNQDMGIDLVARRGGSWYAVQCKYRKDHPDPRHQVISWREISTFYALVARSGPWQKHLIMTSCRGVRRSGGCTEKDLTIARGTFRKLTVEQWYILCGIEGQRLKEPEVDQQAMIEARLKRFSI